MSNGTTDGAAPPVPLLDVVHGAGPVLHAHPGETPDDLAGRVDAALTGARADSLSLALRPHPLGALGRFLLRGRGADLGAVRRALTRHGLSVVDETACLPSLDEPRFLFPAADHGSHAVLLRAFLFPRRYSLGARERLLLRVYIGVTGLLRSPRPLYRGLFLRVRRC